MTVHRTTGQLYINTGNSGISPLNRNQATYLHVGRCQLAVPDQHDGDDVQGGLVQAFPQHLDQLIRDLWTCALKCQRIYCHIHSSSLQRALLSALKETIHNKKLG